MASDDKTRLQPAVGQVAVGTQLSGIYELDAQLGSGGMAEVYRGHNIQTGDLVAIKIVLPEFARDETILSLFRKEASILNHLSHDAVVRYHVFTVDPGIARPYLAMEFVNGQPLSDVLRGGPMALQDVQKLCLRLAAGLAAVHEAHVYHRDLSPDNIILPDGRVDRAKIIDFGIARSAAVGEGTLIGGRFAGKYSYVSPEQLGLFGGEVAEQSDIYSLGLVLAAALRGKPLDMGGSQWEVVEKRRSIPELAGIGDEMRPMIEAMLQPDPRDRPASMTDVMALVRASQAPGDPQTMKPGESSVGRRETGRDADAEPHPAGKREDRPRFVEHVPPSIPGRQRPPPPKPAAPASRAKRPGTPLIVGAAAVVLLLAGSGVYLFMGPESGKPEPAVSPAEETEEIAAAPAPEPALPVVPPGDNDAEPATAPSSPEASDNAGAPEGTEPPPLETTTPVQPAPDEPARPIEEALIELLRDQALPEASPDAEAEAPDQLAAAEPAEPQATEPPIRPPVRQPEPKPEPEVVALPPADPPPAPLPQPTDPFADRVAWLRGFPGGDCFFASVISSTETSTDIEGYGTQIDRFETLLADFQARFGIEPDIHVRPISTAQCAVPDFLRALDSSNAAPGLTLARTSLSSGTPLSGSVEFGHGQTVSLLLVDDDGAIFNLDRFLPSRTSSGSFNIPISFDAAATPQPQVLLAIAASAEIRAASFQGPATAATVLPAIVDEIRSRRLAGAATARYFRVGD